MREKWRLGLHSYQGEVLEGYKKKAHIAEAREQQAFSFFFFLFPALLQRFSVPVLHFFFSPVGFSNFFSVECVDTHQLQQNASADQQ